jgi:hypothetical protein
MAKRPANPAQSFAKRLFEAASKAGINVRVELHPDGMTVVTTTTGPMLPASDDADNELERWMRKHHADPA